jgi:hypothetical protein
MARLFGKDYSRTELLQRIGGLSQVGGVEAMTLDDGPECGVRALRLRGGDLDCTVLPDRCMDISNLTWRGRSLCWHSGTGRVSPDLFQLEDNGFARSFFGGMLTTCGLDNFGPGCVDEGVRRYQHGLIHNVPAANVSWGERWDGDRCTLFATGTMRQNRLFGENLTLARTIEIDLGDDAIRLHDVVKNDGWELEPYLLTYHINVGFPLLDDGAQIRGSFASVEPRDAVAAAGKDGWDLLQGPRPHFKEQVFLATPQPAADNRAEAGLWNPALEGGLGLRLRWDMATLPWLVVWRQLGQGAYVVGLEPTNCRVITGRAQARAANALPTLEPGEERHFTLEFAVVTA